MCTPTAGSPTITLFQLRSNYHTLFNVHSLNALKFIKLNINKIIKCPY